MAHNESGKQLGVRPMTLAFMEKRKESRFTCACGAQFELFARSVSHRSQIMDFSDSGMRLKSRIPIKIGCILMVRATGPWEDSRKGGDRCCPLNRMYGIGQVRWCEKSERHDTEGYLLGLKIQGPWN